MDKKITVSNSTYERLKKHVDDFNETEECVIIKLLDFYDENTATPSVSQVVSSYIGRDNSKYKFNSYVGKKGAVVLEVVKEYITKNEGITYDDLMQVFPSELQGSIGVIKTKTEAEDYVESSSNPELARKRFIFDKIFNLSNGTKIVVCNQWGTTLGGFYNAKQNFPKFIKHCKKHLNYEIARVDGDFL